MATEFEQLRGLMAGFPSILATREHHVLAAKISNKCRQSGVSGSAVGCLIAAMAVATRSQLLTGDGDFELMAPLCGLRLHGQI